MVLHSAREESEPIFESFLNQFSSRIKTCYWSYTIMKSTIKLLFLAAFASMSWVACESSTEATADEQQVDNSLLELEALVETASKATYDTDFSSTYDTDFSSFEERVNHPCYNADSAAVRHEARATIVKFETEIAALAFDSWPDNKLIDRFNTLQLKKLEGLAKFEEATGQVTEVLTLPVGSYNNDNLDALYDELAAKISDSEIEAIKALGYVQELLISLNFQRMEAKRGNIEALRARIDNGEATACDSARVANFRQRAEAIRQNVGAGTGAGTDTTPRFGNGTKPERPFVGQNNGNKARIGGPMLLKYVVKYLENEGITYEPQLISSEVFDKIMTAKGNGQPKNTRRPGQQRRG